MAGSAAERFDGRGGENVSFYSDLQETAEALIAEFGQTVTLRSKSVSRVDPVTGGTSETVTEYAVSGAVFDKDLISSGKSYEDGTTLEKDDRICLISTTAAVPALGDELVIGSVTFSIVNVKIINPAGVDVLYEVAIR